MTKIAGSGSISQRHGSSDPDPDPHQNVIDPDHCPPGVTREKPKALSAVLSPVQPEEMGRGDGT